ncbi:MAG: TonB-dependent receptor [Sphingorhabdus sp.]|uniref:TonB-dependent receptor n=1 Tax=Sphingorhabdus sp. TaxID=1902408 RepID=UPI00273DDA5B|nr:TonB-dependent receptor [Sphingorhabdus sp.]MDP4928051.1 TonB-dependent receptor [Sphingorhabdus sp.]
MNILNIRELFLTSTVLAAGLVISGAAQAQSVPAAEETADQGGIAEIIVTARKSSENIQSVPVAVTALSADDLASKQVFEVTDLARTAPSLTISTGGTGPASIVYLAIRGQAQNSPNSLSDSSVGIYMDGVYVARPIVGNLGFLDMASAEVLRGPQGTLFGRNTTGGALNLTSNRPGDEYEAMLKVGFGNYNYQSIEGMVNAPVSEAVGLRIAGRYGKRDGYFQNDKIGYPQGSIDKDLVLRGTLVVAPVESNLKLTVIADFVRYADDGNATAVAAINPAVLSLPAYGAFINSEFARFVSSAQLPAFTAANSKWTDTFSRPQTGDSQIDTLQNNNEVDAIAGTLEWDLGGVSIKSITAYRKSFTDDSLDLHGFPSSVNPFTPFLPNATSGFISTYNNEQFSEEVQLSGSLGALDWQTGVYYFKESGDEQSRAFILGGVQSARTLSEYSSRSTGAFAQFNYNVTDALRLTGGIRYTWDKRTIDRQSTDNWRKPDNLEVCTVGPNSGKTAEAATCTDPRSASFKYPAWTLGADYRVSDQLFLYAKTSGASMSGGFNSRFVPAPFTQQFNPEKVRDAEVGFKGDFLDRRLRTNMAFFLAKQSNVQRIVNALVGTTLTQFVTNTGKVDAKGFEFEGTALPWDGMELTGSLSYLDAKYVRGSRTENQGTALAPVLVDRSGEPVTQAPKWTWNLGATQTFPTSFGAVSLHADYAYIADRAMDAATAKTLAQGGTQANIDAVAIGNAASIVKGYGLLNGRIAINLDSPDIELAFWGRNLTNQAWFTNVFNNYTGLGATVQFQGAPRTYGATATIKF